MTENTLPKDCGMYFSKFIWELILFGLGHKLRPSHNVDCTLVLFFWYIKEKVYDSGLFDFHSKLYPCSLKIFVKEKYICYWHQKQSVINFAGLAKSCKRTPVHTDLNYVWRWKLFIIVYNHSHCNLGLCFPQSHRHYNQWLNFL